VEVLVVTSIPVVRTLLALSLLGPAGLPVLAETTVAPARGPVVLELFTSQGCSSCPPADLVVSRLGLDDETRSRVIPLAFHVDYWNEIGWTDPFSSNAWSLRQAAYCRALKVNGGPYTPQLVIDGQAEMNGGQGRRVLSQIGSAQDQPSLARVSLEARAADEGGPGLLVVVAAEVEPGLDARKLELRVAVYENGLVTPVSQGENSGRTLRNDFVVRRLQTALTLDPRKERSGKREMKVKLDRDWSRENVGLAAFLQDPSSMRIYAAASLGPAALLPSRGAQP
jgi:hypothetical protein